MPDRMLDLIPQIVWRASPTGDCAYLNRRWYEFTGRPTGADLGSHWLKAVHPDDQQGALENWRVAAAAGTEMEMLFRLSTAQGDYRWVLSRAAPDKNASGQVIEWFGTCSDADKQVHALEAVEKSHNQTLAILKSLQQVVWVADPNGVTEFTDDEWANRHGLDSSPARWWETLHPDDTASAFAAWEANRSGHAYEGQFRMLAASGEYRWMRHRATPELDESGKLIRWYGTTTDVHDRVMAEEALRETAALNKSILESSPDYIGVMDRNGTILYANPPGGAAVNSTDGGDVLGTCWFDLLSEAKEAARKAVDDAASGKTSQFSAIQEIAPGCQKWFDIIATPVGEAGPDARVLVVARDVTQQKVVQRELAEKEALYRGILEASADCIKLIGTDRKLEYMNEPGLCALELHDFAQIKGKDWAVIWPESSRRMVRAAVADALRGETARFTGHCPTALGTSKWWDVMVTPMLDDDGKVIRLLSISRDITGTREASEKLRWASEHDALTSLPNRRAFQAHLQAATIRAMENGGFVGLLLIDLDHFKHVNDSLGHTAGDHLLETFGRRLSAGVRPSAFVARLGGDEFAVILQDVKSESDLIRAGDSILKRLSDPISFGDRVLSAGASIGGALFPRDAESSHELFKNADTALYALKAAGRGGTKMFQQHMREETQKVASQISLARNAISKQSVVPHYQQKVNLHTGRICGFEALLRWQHPTRGIQTPDTVAEAFKDYELASKIGELMQNKVLADIASWIEQGVPFGRVSINAAPAEFLRDDYAEHLLARMDGAGVPPGCIEVEVTEHAFFERGTEHIVTRALRTLNCAGVRISLDDFGTGYSSLSHLRDFPVDVVKIDRSFVAKMVDEPEIASIVTAVIDLARSLSIDVVAEGIETEEQATMLRTRRCAFGQGYLFGRAVCADDVPDQICSQRKVHYLGMPPEVAA